VQASFLEKGGKLAVDELCQRQISFDGLFACSDLLAMTSINSLREKNYRVPEDIKVVGYDDIELARYFHPPLTTIRQSIVQAGNVLVETLLKLVENQDKEEPRLLATELVVRASSQS
jgi:DNA-binding LacI/PurR family transcriptional regulator